jgi:hypothetical protein
MKRRSAEATQDLLVRNIWVSKRGSAFGRPSRRVRAPPQRRSMVFTRKQGARATFDVLAVFSTERDRVKGAPKIYH